MLLSEEFTSFAKLPDWSTSHQRESIQWGGRGWFREVNRETPTTKICLMILIVIFFKISDNIDDQPLSVKHVPKLGVVATIR